MFKKLKSLFNKLKSLAQLVFDLIKGRKKDPIKEGKKNFENPTPEIEALARRRMGKCGCLEDEPISWLAVEDERIPELSNKICGRCGCTAPYLFRQNIKICKKW